MGLKVRRRSSEDLDQVGLEVFSHHNLHVAPDDLLHPRNIVENSNLRIESQLFRANDSHKHCERVCHDEGIS